MRIITLLTDYGLEDNFVGVMKGVILGINPNVRIVDITHCVKPQDIIGAGFLLKGSYRFFPEGTIHLVVVDPGVGSKRNAIVVETSDYFFIGPDNGVLSLALDSVRKVVRITNERYFLRPVSSTFHGRDIFAPVAGYLSKGISVDRFGKETKRCKDLNIPKAKKDGDRIIGQVVYIDHFGNLITNIDKKVFNRFVCKKIRFKGTYINKISINYRQTKKRSPLAIFGSFGNLEISIREGNAKDYFCAGVGDVVSVSI